MKQFTPRSTVQDPSFSHLFLVWFLVGFSLMGLGWDLYEAVPVAFPVSSMGAGLLFGTIVVVSLWIAGFYPPLWGSAMYFITQLGFHLLLVLVLLGGTLGPWQDVGLRVLSIGLAATLSFTDFGRNGRKWLRQRGRSLLKLPPADEPSG